MPKTKSLKFQQTVLVAIVGMLFIIISALAIYAIIATLKAF
jgi:hypothetical protein